MIAEPDEEDPTGVGPAPLRPAVDMNSIVNELAKTEHGVVTLASSQGARPPRNPPPGVAARSPRRWSRSSRAKADLLRDGTITVSELDAFIANRMKALTDGRQHPVMSRPNTIPDFELRLRGREVDR
jgi:hypothetical protein